MPQIRLIELLVKLRGDQLARETAWQDVILARAEVVAERAKANLNDAQRDLIADADSGRIPPVGQHVRDPDSNEPAATEPRRVPPKGKGIAGFRWIDGLKEKDEQAYRFYLHRGDPSSPACRSLAEDELKTENGSEWQRHCHSPWKSAVEKLWLDRACMCAERGPMFHDLRSFEGALFEAAREAWAHGAVQVEPRSLWFLREQDESGYTSELVAALWAEDPEYCEARDIDKPKKARLDAMTTKPRQPAQDLDESPNELVTAESTEWLTDIAWSVHELVLDEHGMERFRAKIWRWYLDVKLRDSECRSFDRRRDEHHDVILATPRLRDRISGPPHNDWEWWESGRPVDVHDSTGRHHRVVFIEGWAPPNLIWEEPEKYWPWPITDRALRVEEKYTLLAAIHDHCCPGVEKIGPWPESGLGDWDAVEGMTFVVLEHAHVPQLSEKDRPSVEAFLREIQDDLRAAAAELGSDFRHSADFRSVRWGGERYSFTKMQAAIVGILWGAWEHGTPDVGVDTLLEAVDSRTSRLPDFFRGHPAWGTMIVDGETKGSKHLADPPVS